ncbi:MAG: hypothetical protein Q8O01_04540, partial [Candidatus Omnitrophota bacterium]|nr:hypothetical protein [Candidatus Omnitrophota bacterium]
RFEWLHTKEDSYFHGIGKPCYRLNTDNGKLGLEDLSCDTSIIAINLAEDVAKIKDFAEKFKDKIAEKAVGMQILIPVPKSNSKIFGQIRASDDPGLKLLRDVISIQLNSEKVLIFETGIRILPVIRTMGYNKSLKHAPMGTVIELTDPDGDRLITAQIVDIKYRDELEALGLAYEILDDKRVLVVFMPNQSFLMTIDFRKEMLKRDKEWDNRNWFMIKTTASAAAWDDWAAAQTDKSYKVKYASTDRWIEVKGVPVVNTPVGFKEIASIMKKAEKQMREAPDKEVIIEDIFGNQINLGLQPSLLFAGEESGGEIFGPTELIDSTNGRKALAMREKSAGEAMVITSAMAADLERKNITLVDYLVSIFKGNKITNQFDYREDVIYFNESEPDINIRKKAEAEGLKMKEENDFFFLAVAVALRDDKITFAGAKAFLEKTFSGVDFTELKAIYFVGDGVYLKFSDRVVEIRPSGTEAKTKGYAMGASPRTLVNDAKELAGYYSGSMREQLMDLLGRDVHAEYFKDAQFMGTTMPAVKARAMEIYNAYLANGAETKPFVPPISYEYLLSKPADEAFTPEAPAVFDYTDASIMQSSSTGERVRNMAVEKFQDKGNRHLIFVKSSIPQIQLATTPAINLASMCGEYYNNVGGYTAHVVDSYEKAVELLAKNTDWNKTNTIVGLVDTNDLEAMSKNLVDNKMEGKTKLLAMEKFSEDQFVPIKGFFDLMSVMVQINKPLDKGNDSELIDGIRSLLNEIGIKDVNGLMDALSAGAYFEDPIKFAKNFIIRLLPPTKPCDTKGMKSLYDAAIAVVKSL